MIVKVIPEQRVEHCSVCPHHKVEPGLGASYCSESARLFTMPDIQRIQYAEHGTEWAYPEWCPLKETDT